MKLPEGTKRVLGGVIGILTTFSLAKGYIDNDTAILIGSLATLILGVGVIHASKKKKQ